MVNFILAKYNIYSTDLDSVKLFLWDTCFLQNSFKEETRKDK